MLFLTWHCQFRHIECTTYVSHDMSFFQANVASFSFNLFPKDKSRMCLLLFTVCKLIVQTFEFWLQFRSLSIDDLISYLSHRFITCFCCPNHNQSTVWVCSMNAWTFKKLNCRLFDKLVRPSTSVLSPFDCHLLFLKFPQIEKMTKKQ